MATEAITQRLAPQARAPVGAKLDVSSRPRSHSQVDAFSPVNNDGCFEFDRVLKSGYVQKRTQKTKKWKSIYVVLRPNTLSTYKNDKEDRLRHQIYLSELTAVAELKDPKHKRHNVFGLFSPSRNYHFQAPTAQDAREWIELIRNDARIDEEEDEMFLARPQAQQQSTTEPKLLPIISSADRMGDHDRFLSSSPEPFGASVPKYSSRRRSSVLESSGWSGGELASHSDFSDNEGSGTQEPPIETLAVQSPANITPLSGSQHPGLGVRSASQTSVSNFEQDPDRVIWQGWLYFLRTRRGVRQWKDRWAVLRPRNLILYKNESEYKAQWILPISAIVNVVDTDPLSKSKKQCLLVISEEKTYKFCAHDEDDLVRCIGAFKSLLAKRRELEARAAASVQPILLEDPRQ